MYFLRIAFTIFIDLVQFEEQYSELGIVNTPLTDERTQSCEWLRLTSKRGRTLTYHVASLSKPVPVLSFRFLICHRRGLEQILSIPFQVVHFLKNPPVYPRFSGHVLTWCLARPQTLGTMVSQSEQLRPLLGSGLVPQI